MAKNVELSISPRSVTGKSTKQLRRQGIIPANISGRGEESQAVQVEESAFEGLRREHHATGMLALRQPEIKVAQTALIRHVQRDPISGKVLHIDFLRVNLADRIVSKVPLHFVGTAPGVKLEGGVLLHQLESLEIECAAGDIVDFVEVDISGLEHIDETIHAKDIKLPEKYNLVTDPEETVAKVTAPRAVRAEAAETSAQPAAAATSTPSQA